MISDGAKHDRGETKFLTAKLLIIPVHVPNFEMRPKTVDRFVSYHKIALYDGALRNLSLDSHREETLAWRKALQTRALLGRRGYYRKVVRPCKDA